MILLASSYREPSPARAAELLECLRRNCENPCIDEVHVLVEDGAAPALRHPKLRLVPHRPRLTYAAAFRYANELPAGRRVILANADIWFDRSLARLEGYHLRGRLLCLSRWDVQQDGAPVYFEFAHSQDAWIFEAPLRQFPCDWQLGLPGCDNRLAYEAAQAGLEVLNPSRSIRAHHLHLSGVRNYGERQRLRGPVLGVPGAVLGTPWLCFAIGGGPADAVERTERSLRQQDLCEVLIAETKRRAAAAADADAVLCFLRSGVEVAPGAAARILAEWTAESFLFTSEGPALVCSKALHDRAGGMDELVAGDDDIADLRASLRALGYAERPFPAGLLRCRSVAEPEPIHRGYSRAKAAVMQEAGQPLPLAVRRGILGAVARRFRDGAPCAAVAFSESMGYTLARLETGASSHNNDGRPFLAVPAPLRGKPFTQVVAFRVSPVAVQFLTSGKLYVLVGTDWEGHRPAAAWLEENGLREDIPPLRTGRGTSFVVWSVMGAAGEELVLPTQVMLVSDHLERRA